MDDSSARLLAWIWLALAFVQWRRAVRSSDRSKLARELRWFALTAIAAAPIITWWLLDLLDVDLAADPLLLLFVAVLPPAWMVVSFRLREFGTTPLDRLPLIDDPEVVDSADRFARALGTPSPTLRSLSIGGRRPVVMAFAVGPIERCVLLSTGLLRRLEPKERDTILAHEMAHLANGSTWFYEAIVPMSAAAAVLVGTLDGWAPIPVGLLAFVGLTRLVIRPFEHACDKKSVALVGVEATASGLDKVHAANRLAEDGVAGLLHAAFSTHPAKPLRLASIDREDRRLGGKGIEIDRAAVRKHRNLVRSTFMVWAVVLGAAIVLPTLRPNWSIGIAIICSAAALLPGVIRMIDRMRRTSSDEDAGDRRRRLLTIACAIVGFTGVMGMIAKERLDFGMLGALGIIAAMAIRVLSEPGRRFAALIEQAASDRRWDDVIAHAEREPELVTQRAATTMDLTRALLHAKRAKDALRTAEAAARRFPDHAGVLEVALEASAVVLVERHEASSESVRNDAIAKMAREALRLHARYDIVVIRAARLLAEAGAAKDAAATLDQLLDRHPDDADALAARAEVRLILGDEPGSRADAERALALEPGDPIGLTVLSRLAHAAAMRLPAHDPARAAEVAAAESFLVRARRMADV